MVGYHGFKNTGVFDGPFDYSDSLEFRDDHWKAEATNIVGG